MIGQHKFYRIGQALVRGLLVLWVALTLIFFSLRILPSDSIVITLTQSGATQAQIEEQREALCLNCPLVSQYLAYLNDIVTGDLGFSTRYSLPVVDVMRSRLGPTLSLGMAALGIALMVGLGLGLANGVDSRFWRNSSEVFIVFAQSVPIYLTATFAVAIFAVNLDLLPSSGSSTPLHLVLPATVLGFHVGGNVARVLGISLRDTLNQPFMLTARAKGLPPIDQLDHALRIALLPVLSVIALQAGFLLGGTVIIEFIFVRRGLGSLMIESVQDRDYAMVQAFVLFSTLLYLIANTISTLGRYLLDPRLRDSSSLN